MGKRKIGVSCSNDHFVIKLANMHKMLLFFFACNLEITVAAQPGKSSIALTDTVMEATLRSIRNIYNTVNHDSKSMRVVTADVPDKSAEGGVSKKWYTGNDLCKLTVQLYGETGRFTGEYYFHDRKLVFYYTLEERYQSSIGVPGNKVVSKKQDRFYFFDDKLIRWTGPDGQVKSPDLYPAKEKEIILELKEYTP